MKKYFVETIGTFFTVLTDGLTVMKLANVSHLWIYLTANPVAGVLLPMASNDQPPKINNA